MSRKPAGGILGAAALSFVLALLPPRDARSSRPEGPVSRPFSHVSHVSDEWLRGSENLRDCRGCHSYGADGTRDPQSVCAECHFRGTFEIELPDGADPAFRKGLEPLREDNSPVFDHAEHGRLACRECHAPDSGRPVIPKFMPVRRGAAVCARCHDKDAPREFLMSGGRKEGDPPLASDKFFDRIDADASMGPERLGRFLHAEHLGDPGSCPRLEVLLAGSDESKSCLPCHEGIVTAKTPDFHGGLFEPGRCGECHLSRGEAASATLATGVRDGKSRSLLTFSHADHVKAVTPRDPSKATAEGYERISDHACLACHAYGGTGFADATGDYRFLRNPHPAAHEFEGCVTCHADAAWKPVHERWSDEDRACTKCHDFGRGDMRIDRPTVEVTRERAQSFKIAGQSHPLVTVGEGAAAVVDEACGECHKAAIQKLPSRIQDRPFNHLTHVGQNPDSKKCDDCHSPAINLSDGSAEIGERTYDVKKCVTCHRDGLVAVPAPGGPETVVRFPHRTHLEAKNPRDSRTCLDCHALDPRSGGADYATIDEARSCTKCHDHAENGPNVERTGGVSGREVESCRKCHRSASGLRDSVPEVGREDFAVQRLELGRQKGSQHHPPGRACSECHSRGAEEISSRIELAARVFRDDRGNSDVHTPEEAPGAPPVRPAEQEKCLGCHWRMKRPEMQYDPAAADVRRRFGDRMIGFPGWPDRPGRGSVPK